MPDKPPSRPVETVPRDSFPRQQLRHFRVLQRFSLILHSLTPSCDSFNLPSRTKKNSLKVNRTSNTKPMLTTPPRSKHFMLGPTLLSHVATLQYIVKTPASRCLSTTLRFPVSVRLIISGPRQLAGYSRQRPSRVRGGGGVSSYIKILDPLRDQEGCLKNSDEIPRWC